MTSISTSSSELSEHKSSNQFLSRSPCFEEFEYVGTTDWGENILKAFPKLLALSVTVCEILELLIL